MVKHVVMWTLKEDNKTENISKMIEMLHRLKTRIDEIVDLTVGKDFNRSSAAYDICLIVTFDSKDDVPKYQNHPEHLKVVEFVKGVVEGRAVVDFEI